MIIFFSKGRLGNQIFQYAFLKKNQKPNEKLFMFGSGELEEVFDLKGCCYIDNRYGWNRRIGVWLERLLNVSQHLKCVSKISIISEKILDKYFRESTTFEKKGGLLFFIRYVELGFFQSESFFDKNIKSYLSIKSKYFEIAQTILKDIPMDAHKIFVHVRRGDYESFTIYGKSTLLPLQYYLNQINWFMENKPKCFFIFLTDDASYVEDNFSMINNKFISRDNSYGVDLSIMSLCQSAILSPSSFSWWGSYFMTNRDKVFAPKYWAGFDSKIDCNANPLAGYMSPVDIN